MHFSFFHSLLGRKPADPESRDGLLIAGGGGAFNLPSASADGLRRDTKLGKKLGGSAFSAFGLAHRANATM